MPKSLREQYEELIAAKLLDAVDDRVIPRMPSYYVSVPTITTYGSVPMGPIGDACGKLGADTSGESEGTGSR